MTQEALLFINGEWTKGEQSFHVINPANQEIIAHAHAANVKKVDEAITASQKAFPEWSKLSVAKRSNYLLDIKNRILQKKKEIAEILSMEQGKPFTEAIGEVIYSSEFFGWYAEEAKRLNGELVPAHKENHELRIEHVPVGVVAAITPWNFPAGMLARKLAPALAAGCTTIVKPASQTPLTAVKLFEIFEEAGLPPGVVNLVMGSGKTIGEQLLSDKRVKKVTFTGSTEVGSSIMEKAAKHITRISLELGGHAPFIVMDDVDLDVVIKDLLMIKFRASGQTCISPNRVFVHERIYDLFQSKLTEQIKGLKVGAYNEENVAVGPLIDQNAIHFMQSQVDDAINKGAKLLHGGTKSEDPRLSKGNFYTPTILSYVTPDMLIYYEETFGPIISLIPFQSDEDLLTAANDSDYGLAAYLYSQNYKRARDIVKQLDYGTIAVNNFSASDFAQAPVGGMKKSGIGREGGREGLKDYTETKFSLINYH